MAEVLAQKTCCMAAHSASAQVITIASAFGRLVEVLLSSLGAALAYALQNKDSVKQQGGRECGTA